MDAILDICVVRCVIFDFDFIVEFLNIINESFLCETIRIAIVRSIIIYISLLLLGNFTYG